MSKWRARALELFPDIRPAIQTAATPGELWSELFSRLEKHYSSVKPPECSPDFARKVYMYALWCHSAADWHTRADAEMSFFEDIVPFAIRSGKSVYDRIVDDLVAHIGVPTIKNNSVSFGYRLSPQQLQHFLKSVDEAAKRRARRSAKKRI